MSMKSCTKIIWILTVRIETNLVLCRNLLLRAVTGLLLTTEAWAAVSSHYSFSSYANNKGIQMQYKLIINSERIEH
jgi:hypothetical protein